MPGLFHSTAVPDRINSNDRPWRNPVRLTPLIDVVFILLIFFMLASNYEDWHAVPVDVPVRAEAAIDSVSDVVLVEIAPDQLRLSAETIPRDVLIAHLESQLLEHPDLVVLIKPVDGVLLQEVVSLIDLLSDSGMVRISLIR